MRILFLNKYDIHGGAAIAAWRLLLGLKEDFNADIKLLCGIKKSNYSFVNPTRQAGIENLFERVVNFGMNQVGLQYVWFPFSTKRILKMTKEFQPDIIFMHNIHSGYVDLSLLPKLSKLAPLVWTLHDMWAFTANGAYIGNDDSWKQMKSCKDERKQFPEIGLNTGNWLLQRKKRIYEQSDITFVCPSNWLRNLASQSPLLHNKKVHQLFNGVDTDCFSPSPNKLESKSSLGISSDEIVILFYAQNIKDPRKGGADLIKILNQLDASKTDKVTLLTIGSGKLEMSFNYLKVKEVGYVSGDKSIAHIIQAADIFLFPTFEDNLPNTLIEVSACGIASLSYDAGGCGEIVINSYNGLLSPIGDTDHFLKNLIYLLNNPSVLKNMQSNARLHALENFDIHKSAKSYFGLFKKLIENRVQTSKN